MTKMRAALLQGVVILAALGASAARADLENENLLVTTPPGYKVGFTDKKPNMLMTEFVPAKETVENWTEMVTVQVFFGLKTTPQQFMDDMDKRWRAACPEAITRWMGYLRKVSVCNSRVADRACPKTTD